MKVDDALSGIQQLFLDTSPVIFYVEGHPVHQAVTDAVFGRVANGLTKVATSPITLAECLVHPYRKGDARLIQQFQSVITSAPNTRYVGLDMVASEAARFRAKYNLTLTDAFQVAAAIAAGCDAFLTNDDGLKRVTEIRVLILHELTT